MRQALGAAQVDLIGVSYGTRVAQQYAKRYPAQTRAVVLDGVLPNDVVAGGEFARTFERSLQLRDAACAKDPVCSKRYPSQLRAQLETLKTRLAAKPVEVDYRDPSTGEMKHDTLTAQTVVGLTQLFSYVPQAAALLPVVVDEAVHERYGPLMALASLGGESMAGGMDRCANATRCSSARGLRSAVFSSRSISAGLIVLADGSGLTAEASASK